MFIIVVYRILFIYAEVVQTVQYLIFQANIPLSRPIEEYLHAADNWNGLGNNNVLKMFDARENYHKMNETLPTKPTQIAKHYKI